ncbi:MAG: M20/M25/M40 family metallo-hydrolase [Armatimonadota bacterium]
MSRTRSIDDAQRILAAASSDDTGYRRLGWLCDRIGNRLAGSEGLERAVRWSAETLSADGFDRVSAEPVMVPRWVRGHESLVLRAPESRALPMLGLGGSVGTPRAGIEAPVLVVGSFDELAAQARDVRGRIVCFDVPFTSYGATVAYRARGASEAARLGAVAVLVRSVGPTSLRTPHTGSLSYAADAPRIPAAAITIEDATMLARMQARGESIRVHLRMAARQLPDVESANVVADLIGTEQPEEIVLLGGHLDSWDVGAGAHDDGGGCMAAWEAVRLLKALGLRPRRTVRVVLFTNEENGLRGATEYAKRHRIEVPRHVLAVESDSGVADPKGFGLSARTPGGYVRAKSLLEPLLAPFGAGSITDGGGGADVGPLGAAGVSTMGLSVDMSLYWSIHHTPADTFDKVDRAAFGRCVAAMAIVAKVAADTEDRW